MIKVFCENCGANLGTVTTTVPMAIDCECGAGASVIPTPEKIKFSVAIYLVNMAYGGGEEGGWWYMYGEPEGSLSIHTRTFESEESAYEYADTLYHIVDSLNNGRPRLSSVSCCGVYSVRVERGAPKAFPEQTPHYE